MVVIARLRTEGESMTRNRAVQAHAWAEVAHARTTAVRASRKMQPSTWTIAVATAGKLVALLYCFQLSGAIAETGKEEHHYL